MDIKENMTRDHTEYNLVITFKEQKFFFPPPKKKINTFSEEHKKK